MPNPLMGPVLSDVPVRTMGREEVRQKLARRERIKLVMCLNEWAFRAIGGRSPLHLPQRQSRPVSRERGHGADEGRVREVRPGIGPGPKGDYRNGGGTVGPRRWVLFVRQG